MDTKKTEESQPSYISNSNHNQPEIYLADRRLVQSASKLSNIRIMRIKSSQIAQIRYTANMKESDKRTTEIKEKRLNEICLNSRQKSIQLEVNRQRAVIVHKEQRKMLFEKLENKYKANEELQNKTIQEFEDEKKIANFRNWQNIWLQTINQVMCIKQLSLLLPILKELKSYGFRELISATKIQTAWRRYIVLKGIKLLNVRQKFLFAWIAKKIKAKVKILRLKASLKHVANTIILDSIIRKKMRLGLSRTKVKIIE